MKQLTSYNRVAGYLNKIDIFFLRIGDRRKFCVIDEPRQYENHRLSQE